MPSKLFSMQQLKLVFLSLLLSGILPWPASSSFEGVTYYVQSDNPQSQCPDYPCKRLSYYFDNSDRLISNGRHSITMIFLKGDHLHVPHCGGILSKLNASPNLEIIGEYTDTVIYCMVVHFRRVFKLHIQQLKLVDCRVQITPIGRSSLISSTQVQIFSVKMKNGVIEVTDIA